MWIIMKHFKPVCENFADQGLTFSFDFQCENYAIFKGSRLNHISFRFWQKLFLNETEGSDKLHNQGVMTR